MTELDESTVAIGGLVVYPVGPDGLHYYYSDLEQSGATDSNSNDAGAASPR